MKSPAATKNAQFSLSGQWKKDDAYADAPAEGIDERRTKARINKPFPTIVHGTDSSGENFEVDCSLDNISSTGLYLRIPRSMELGSDLSLVVKFENGNGTGATARLHCQVLRAEPQRDGLFGIATTIRDYQFF